MRSIASRASRRVLHTITPLPAARPSAFTTTGTDCSSLLIAVHDVARRAVGIAKDAVIGRRHVGPVQAGSCKRPCSLRAGRRLSKGRRRAASRAGRHRRCPPPAAPPGRPRSGRRCFAWRTSTRPGMSSAAIGTFSRLAGGAGVAGGDEDLLRARALRDLPRQRVLAPAVADDEDLHFSTHSSRAKRPPEYRSRGKNAEVGWR